MTYYNFIYYVLTFAYRIIITMKFPIVTLFAMTKGNSLVNIGIGYSIMALTSIVCDMPFGGIADKYSKKFVFILGLLLEALSAFIFIYCANTFYLFIAFILWGAGIAASTGILQSWYVNLYNSKSQSFALAKIFKYSQIFANIATFLGIVLSAVIAQFYGYSTAFLIIALSLVAYAIFSLIVLNKIELNNPSIKNVQSINEFFSIFKDQRVMSTLLFSSVLGFIYSGYAVIWPPIFKEIVGQDISNSLIKSSFIYSLLYLISGLSLIYIDRFLKFLHSNLYLQVYILRIIFSICFLCMGFAVKHLVIFAITTLIMFIVGYLEYAPLQVIYNKFLPDEHRTLGLSISTTCERILSSFGGFVITLIYADFGNSVTLWSMAFIAILSIVPFQKTLLNIT